MSAAETPGSSGTGPERGGAAPSGAGRGTYGQILKSSALIGTSSIFTVAIGILRSKAVALLLGPTGVGLMGLYASILTFAQSVAGMGITGSGVRQIAAAVGTGETERVARTAAVLRKTSVVLGVLGAGVLAALSWPVSVLTFGEGGRAGSVALLSLALLCRILGDGQSALLQGLRRIPDLARIAVFGGALGAAVGIALVVALGEGGIAPALIAMTLAPLGFSWTYSRREALPRTVVSASEVRDEARALLRLGVAFMASGIVSMGTAYAVRLLVTRTVGLDGAGLYQSAWTIGGLYVGFVLQSMGADFYPRLAGQIERREEANRLVNEQAEVSMLLAGPGVIATLGLAPLVISLFYSSEFGRAVEVLRWITLGATLQVLTWPLGYVVVAAGRQTIFLVTEVAYGVVHLALAWTFVRLWGVNGAGIAFFGSYVFHAVMIYPVVRGLTGFRWSSHNLRTGAAFLASIGTVFVALALLPAWAATLVAVAALALSGLYSVRRLVLLVSAERLPARVRRLLELLRLA